MKTPNRNRVLSISYRFEKGFRAEQKRGYNHNIARLNFVHNQPLDRE